MSYVSPIKIGYAAEPEEGWTDKIGKYIAGEVDNLVLESCVKVGCHVDKDELEKALRYDRDQYDRGYADGKRDAASPWHRAEDELPPPNKTVLVCKIWGDVNGEPHKVITMDSFTISPSDSVIAWMPLPEPPKEDA